MKFKTLKHKIHDTYGVVELFGDKLEMCTSGIPRLQPMTATIEVMKQYYSRQYPGFVEILNDYELIIVELTIPPAFAANEA